MVIDICSMDVLILEFKFSCVVVSGVVVKLVLEMFGIGSFVDVLK